MCEPEEDYCTHQLQQTVVGERKAGHFNHLSLTLSLSLFSLTLGARRWARLSPAGVLLTRAPLEKAENDFGGLVMFLNSIFLSPHLARSFRRPFFPGLWVTAAIIRAFSPTPSCGTNGREGSRCGADARRGGKERGRGAQRAGVAVEERRRVVVRAAGIIALTLRT